MRRRRKDNVSFVGLEIGVVMASLYFTVIVTGKLDIKMVFPLKASS